MFKKILTLVMCSSLVFTSVPSYAGSFGKPSSSSSSKSTSAPKATPPAPKQSSAPKERTQPRSSQSAQSAQSQSQKAESQKPKSGSVSGGQTVGMANTQLAEKIRNGTNAAPPANNTTVAGRNPVDRNAGYNNSNTASNRYTPPPSYNSGNTYPDNRRYGNDYYNSRVPNYQQPRQGYGMGTVIGAAAVGALVGYMLHRDSSGNVYYTNPSQPNVAFDSNGQRMSSVPAGNYQPMGTVNSDGSLNSSGVISNNAGLAAPSVTTAPAQNSNGGTSGFVVFLLLLLLAGVGVAIYMLMRRQSSSSVQSQPEYTPMNTDNRNPEEKLRDEAANIFVQFQKNNRPSQVSVIRANSHPIFFEAIEDTVLEQSDEREVKVRALETTLHEIREDGTKYKGEVRFQATLEEVNGSQVTQTVLDELWSFVYEGNKWLVSGMTDINPAQVTDLSEPSQAEELLDFNKRQGKYQV